MTTPLGKYKLVKLIAAGGMAEVYLARQAGAAGFEKLVCLKRILPHLARDKQFVEMFLNEARLAAQLDHPNIVSIFDLGESNGNYFIAMEFIDGPNLRAVARRAAELNELLPVPEVLKIVSMAAAGLQYAHDLCDARGNPLGLVHRDISPDNILVHRNGAAKVVDFGIAKAATSASQTRTGTLKGKVAYMPPEQLRGETLDRRTDVFALGVVLYELIAGRRPWDGPSEVALIGRIVTEEPQPLDELREGLPPELVAIVARTLCKDRAGRYQSCQELQADLEQLIVRMGQSITPSRVSDFIKAYAPAPARAGLEATDATLGAVEEESFAGTGAAPQLVLRGPPQPRAAEPGTVLLAAPPPPRGRGLLYGIAGFAFIAMIGGGAGFFFLRGHAEGDQGPVQIGTATVADKPRPPPVEPAREEARPAAAPAAVPPAVTPAVTPAVPDAKAEGRPGRGVDRNAEASAGRASDAASPGHAGDANAGEGPVRGADAKAGTDGAREVGAEVHARPQPRPRVRKIAAVEEEPAAPAPMVVVQEAPKAPPPTITAKGELVLLIRPWARVEVDGLELGVTPLEAPVILAAGDHEVRLVNPDLGKDVRRTVHITASGREVLKAILDE